MLLQKHAAVRRAERARQVLGGPSATRKLSRRNPAGMTNRWPLAAPTSDAAAQSPTSVESVLEAQLNSRKILAIRALHIRSLSEAFAAQDRFGL